MAKALQPEDVLFLQRFLSCCGFYTDTLDGLWGKNTDDADQAFHARSQEIASSQGSFDARSERCILSLQCDAQVAARQSLTSLLQGGRDARIISGTRTYAEQNVLF